MMRKLGQLKPAQAGMMLAVAMAGLATAGCTKVRNHQGYLIDQALVDAVQPGIDNRTSVERTLGRPTMEGGFDKKDWYYVARDTRQFGFTNAKVKDQTVLIVRFDPAGNVTSLDKQGMSQIADISPAKGKTPTLGGKGGLLHDLFGNIGAVGAGSTGANAPTQDNPTGGR